MIDNSSETSKILPNPVEQISQENNSLWRGIDIVGLSEIEKAKYETLLRDTTPSSLQAYQGLTFRDSLIREAQSGTITLEKLENLSKIYKSPENGQWKEIFEKNYNLTPELAKADRIGWSSEMKDTYRQWKIERAKQIDTTVIALDQGISTKKETVIAKKTEDRKLDETIITNKTEDRKLDETIITKKNEALEAQEKLKKGVDTALSLLSPSINTEIKNSAEEELRSLQDKEKSGKKPIDNGLIVRASNGSIDPTLTLSRIQASIILTNGQKYKDTISAPKDKEKFQEQLDIFNKLDIPPIFKNKESLLPAIKNDKALPTEVALRHEETARTLLDGASGVSARRYNNGTYIIDYTKGGQDERLILDGLGNVTRSKNGLEITTNSLREKSDIGEKEKKQAHNRKLDQEKGKSINQLNVFQDEIDGNNWIPDEDMVKLVPLVPDIRSTKELISTFKGLTFPKNNKIGTQKLSDIRSIQKENEGKIQKTQESLIYTGNNEGEKTRNDDKKKQCENLFTKNKDSMSEVENLGKLINKYETINEGPSKFGENMATFDANAGKALKRLTNSGYDELEQDNLDALMRALSVRDGKTGIWKNPEIDMNDKYNREKQLKDLEQVAKRFQEDRGNNPKTQDENSFRNIFQDIKNGIKGNEAFRHVWNSPEGLAIWISHQGSQKKAGEPTRNSIESKAKTVNKGQ